MKAKKQKRPEINFANSSTEQNKNLYLLKAAEAKRRRWREAGMVKPVSVAAIWQTRTIILALKEQPYLMLSPLGFYQLEFENDLKDYLEFSHITGDKTCKAYLEYGERSGIGLHTDKAMIECTPEVIKGFVQIFLEHKYDEIKSEFAAYRQYIPMKE